MTNRNLDVKCKILFCFNYVSENLNAKEYYYFCQIILFNLVQIKRMKVWYLKIFIANC